MYRNKVLDTVFKGLDYYKFGNENLKPYTFIKEKELIRPKKESMRYALILQIGIKEWLTYHPEVSSDLPDLWPAIEKDIINIHNLSDYALLLWAAVSTKYSDIKLIAEKTIVFWKEQKLRQNSVEVSWVLKAMLVYQDYSGDFNKEIESVIHEATDILTSQFHTQAHLFYRHRRKGFNNFISRRIACFADQVYPIIALSHYVEKYNDLNVKDIVKNASDSICRFQGAHGQWVWHYDVDKNRVCEEYPVFSVHQDSMAPMALFAGDKVTGSNHKDNIELGMKWLFGDNELNQKLIFEDQGIIWRDIERDESEKYSRRIKGLFFSLNLPLIGRILAPDTGKFKINYEYRPYHYGWILYAWANNNI